jgi:uncharacterized protein (TIGR01244 family)
MEIVIGLAVVCLWATITTRHVAAVEPPAASPTKTELKEIELGSVRPLFQFGNIYFAGQPNPGDLKTLQQHGIKTVVTLRPKVELDWDERAAVEALGMRLVEVPVTGVKDFTEDKFAKVREVLRSASEQEPVILHCASATRVGAAMIAFRVLDQGASVEQARSEAERVGLKSAAFVDLAQAYIQRFIDSK